MSTDWSPQAGLTDRTPPSPPHPTPPRATTARADADATADQVAMIFSRHLDDRRVAVHDDFFAIGGNSLIGIRIIEDIAGEYGVILSVRDFYLAQTPSGVANLIVREGPRR